MSLPLLPAPPAAHEYTAGNARFALSVDADNPALQKRAAEVEALRAAGQPTVPRWVLLEPPSPPGVAALLAMAS